MMDFKYNPKRYYRRSIRLKDYDYSQPGAYFVTICTHNRKCIFGEIVNGEMVLNKVGEIVKRCWLDIPERFSNVKLDEFVIMPNHIHGIIVIVETANSVAQNDKTGASPVSTLKTGVNPVSTLGDIVGTFKSLCAYKCRNEGLNVGKLWQQNYYEHIIRNEIRLNKIREYIINNPIKWELDIENPENKKQYKSTTDYFKEVIK